MPPLGFRHFAQQSPNHLALAAPDGRHWSRSELRAECDRISCGRQPNGLAGSDSVAASLPHCAGLIAMALAFEIEPPAVEALEPPHVIEKARRLMEPFGIQPEQDNVHYCVSPPDCDEAMAWALASLHYGHPVVLADKWDAQSMLRDIARYRVTISYLSPDQFTDLLLLPEDVRRAYDVSSIQHLVYGGTPCPPGVKQAIHNCYGLPIHAQPDSLAAFS
jgi:acyl-coenzyme A synthetase/AMP-(fatty) acid ligase